LSFTLQGKRATLTHTNNIDRNYKTEWTSADIPGSTVTVYQITILV